MKRYVLIENHQVVGECWTHDAARLPIGNGVSAIEHATAKPGWQVVDGEPVEPTDEEEN